MENAGTFGAQAARYAAARPRYPDALFDWIAQQAPTRRLAWDVGTGNGQAATSLADRFDAVHATDLSDAQIAAAPCRPGLRYEVAPAHASGLSAGTVDVVTVATALHWFDLPAFWAEVARVCRPNALFVAWTYHRIEADEAVQRHLLRPILALVEPYWSEGNRLSWRGYPPDEIGFPFAPLEAPDLACSLDWTPAQLVGFVRTWSAHARARGDGLIEELAAIETAALAVLGAAPRPLRFPLKIRAGRVLAP